MCNVLVGNEIWAAKQGLPPCRNRLQAASERGFCRDAGRGSACGVWIEGGWRMKVGLTMLRGGLAGALPAPVGAATSVPSPAAAQSASSIVVEGNRRVEAETIRTYFKPGPGGRLDSGSINDGLRALYETGLFQDVRINQAGGRLVVTVVENPVISRVIFEGNKKVKDEQLATEVQSKPRGSLSRPMVQSDTQRITEIYRRQGRYDVTVVPQIIEQPNNRVDLIFEVTEG